MEHSSSGGLAPIAELIEDIRADGDDEDRENEGDISRREGPRTSTSWRATPAA